MKKLMSFLLISLLSVGSASQAMDHDAAENRSFWQCIGKPASQGIGGLSFLTLAYGSHKIANGFSTVARDIAKNAGKSDSLATGVVQGFFAGVPALGSIGFRGMTLFSGMTGCYLLYKAYNNASGNKKA
jgi:hypothetical protein